MRLFTGLSIPEEVTYNLTELLHHLQPAAHLNWSPPYNLHLTTKFLGEWPEARLPELTAKLRGLQQRPPLELRAEGIGWFPNPHSPRILFVPVKAVAGLEQLANDTSAACEELGIAAETKKFSPHLTLARVKDPAVPLGPLRAAIASLKNNQFGSWTAHSFHLYMSKPGPSGSIYTQIAEFPFAQ